MRGRAGMKASLLGCGMLVVAACSGAVTSTTGTDGGPGGGDASTNETGTGTGTGTGTSGGGGGGGDASIPIDASAGAPIYCSTQDNACLCGHDAQYGAAGAPCRLASVPFPALCCASTGWPAGGGCDCVSLGCDQYDFSTCICGAVGTPVKAVASCAQPAGGVCCLDTGALGTQICGCHTDLKQCPPDQQTVAGCSVPQIGCNPDSAKQSACQ